MIRFRALLIAAGYPDGDACRLENLPSPIAALSRMLAAMIALFCYSFAHGAGADVSKGSS